MTGLHVISMLRDFARSCAHSRLQQEGFQLFLSFLECFLRDRLAIGRGSSKIPYLRHGFRSASEVSFPLLLGLFQVIKRFVQIGDGFI